MNLNTIETAEALENIYFVTDPTIVCNYAATMLRKQQEKIATWEESFYNSVAENGKLRETIRQQQAEIERLQRLCESYIRSDYEGTSMFKPFMEELYGKAQEK